MGTVVFFSAVASFFLYSGEILYDPLIQTKSPLVTPDFSAVKNILFAHFLSVGSALYMCFLIAIIDDPILLLKSAITFTIPVL